MLIAVDKQKKTKSNKYLTVGVHFHYITETQAQDVYRTQTAFCNHEGLLTPRVGEVAQLIGVLTREGAEEVETKQEDVRSRNETFDDPIDERSFGPNAPRYVRRRVIVALILVAAFIGTGLASHWNGSTLATAATLLGFLFVVLEQVFPSWLGGDAKWRLLVKHASNSIFLVFIFGLLTTGTILYRNGLLPPIALSFPLSITQAFYLFAAGVLFLALISRMLAEWRHHEIWILESRHDLVALLSATTGASGRRRSNRIEAAKSVMDLTANILECNLWNQVLSWLLLRDQAVRSVALWYAQPSDTSPNEFDNIIYSCPSAPDQVHDLAEEIKETHHPARFEETEFRRLCRDCLAGGKLDVKKLRSQPRLHEIASATGYVFHKRSRLFSSDARECLVYDGTFLSKPRRAKLSRKLRRWFDYKSFVAYPVFLADEESRAIGVLIAHRTCTNGFLPEDQYVLRLAASLVGQAMSPLHAVNPGPADDTPPDKKELLQGS